MAYRLNYSDYSTASGPPDPAEWVGPPGPQGVPGPVGPQGIPGPGGVPEAPSDGPIYGRGGSTLAWTPTLPIAGGVMTGALSLFGNATLALHAVPLQQIQATIGVNVRDYGAKGDGVTDDTGAINAALNYARSIHVSGHTTFRLTFPAGRYVVTAPLNFTGFTDSMSGSVIDGCGSEIWAKMSGGVVIDCLGSRWLTFRDLTVYGDTITTPRIGFQIGRTGNTGVGDYHTFANVKAWGNFQLAPLYNHGAEQTSFYSCEFRNDMTGANRFCAVLDGMNHWAVASTFVTVTAATETNESFLTNLFVACTFQGQGSNGAVWLGNTGYFSFARCYASAPSWIFSLYKLTGTASPASSYLDIECHCEGTGLQKAVVVTAAASETTIYFFGLSFSDIDCHATVSVLGIDPAASGLTTADVRAGRFRVAGGTPLLFDTPSKWRVQAEAAWLMSGRWQVPQSWTGPLVALDNTDNSFLTLPRWGSTDRPNPVTVGTMGYAIDTQTFEYYDVTGWHSWLSTLGGSVSGAVNLTSASMSSGVAFTGTAATTSDLSKHVQLGGGNGFNIASGRMNTVFGGSFYWVNGTTDIASMWSDGLHLIKGFGVWNSSIPASKPIVTGAKGSNAALASLLTALAAYGLVTDSSTA